MTTNREAYEYERGRYDHYNATARQRMQCAPTPAANERIYQEGQDIRARLDQLADAVRAERNAMVRPAAAATARRYEAAICAVRCVLFPSGVWILTPAAPSEGADELARIERQWSRAADDAERVRVADDAERLASRTTGRNAATVDQSIDLSRQIGFEEGRYYEFRRTLDARLRCAGPADRDAIVREAEAIKRRMENLLRTAREMQRNATPAKPRAPSVEERYHAAVDYVRRALAVIAPSIFEFWERSAYETKTAPYKNELQRIEARWSVAKTDAERAAVARDAELLADHTQETMPGAPQDRQRTNLFKGETPQHAPATSYLGELTHSQPSSAVPVVRDDGASWKKYAAVAALGAGGVLALRALLK